MGESDGRRVTHAPSCATHALAREGHLSEKDQRVGARLSEFLPSVDRLVADESTGGDISMARVVARKVAEKTRRR